MTSPKKQQMLHIALTWPRLPRIHLKLGFNLEFTFCASTAQNKLRICCHMSHFVPQFVFLDRTHPLALRAGCDLDSRWCAQPQSDLSSAQSVLDTPISRTCLQ